MKEKIQKLLDKTISQEELDELSEYRALSDENANQVAQMVAAEMARRMADDQHYYDADRAYARFESRRRPRLSRRPMFLRIAAAIIVILGVAAVWFFNRDASQNAKTMLAQYVEVTGVGETRVITLPDGTTVALCPSTTLRYDESYGAPNRSIQLEGEAVFTVTHDSEHPFSVVTSSVTVRDLGTRFRLSDYVQDAIVTLQLIEGEVNATFNHERKTVSLQPGQGVRFDKAARSYQVYPTNMSADDISNTSQLLFENETLANVAKKLSQIYGAEIVVSDEAGPKKLFGVFNSQEDSLDTILQALAVMSQSVLTKQGDTYIMR